MTMAGFLAHRTSSGAGYRQQSIPARLRSFEANECGTPGWERLRFLSVLVQAHEEEHDPLARYEGEGTPQSAVDFALARLGMTRAELAPVLGGSSRVSEFFTGKRSLSIGQIRKLRDALGIPADLLLG